VKVPALLVEQQRGAHDRIAVGPERAERVIGVPSVANVVCVGVTSLGRQGLRASRRSAFGGDPVFAGDRPLSPDPATSSRGTPRGGRCWASESRCSGSA
jgi:hypothetical protein